MTTKIEIERTHPGSVNETRRDIKVIKTTVTRTLIELPDVTGIHQTGLPDGDIELDLSGIGKSSWEHNHTVRVSSVLLNGEHILPLSIGRQAVVVGKRIDEHTMLHLSTDAAPRTPDRTDSQMRAV